MKFGRFQNSHLEDFESLSLPLQESVEKTKIRWNIRCLTYVSCLNTPLIKNDCWAWEPLLRNLNIYIDTENSFFYSSVPIVCFLWGVLMILRAITLIKINYWAWERLLKNLYIFIETQNGFLYSPVPFIRFLWGVLMIVNAIPVVWSNFQTWGNIVEKVEHFPISKFSFQKLKCPILWCQNTVLSPLANFYGNRMNIWHGTTMLKIVNSEAIVFRL